MRFRRTVAFVLLLLLPCSAFAVDGKNAMYVGGTVHMRESAEGHFDTSNDDQITFIAKGEQHSIRYDQIIELEYGQKAGRRVAVAIMISPFALFSKKRKHYLTISYKDDAGKEQAAVFELGKDVVRTTLKILETRSGKPITFQDEEARKSLGGGK